MWFGRIVLSSSNNRSSRVVVLDTSCSPDHWGTSRKVTSGSISKYLNLLAWNMAIKLFLFFLTWNHELGSVLLKETLKDAHHGKTWDKRQSFKLCCHWNRSKGLLAWKSVRIASIRNRGLRREKCSSTASTQKEKPSFLGDLMTDIFEGFKYPVWNFLSGTLNLNFGKPPRSGSCAGRQRAGSSQPSLAAGLFWASSSPR